MTAPIEPRDYLYGPKVIDIGDARVRRGKSVRNHSACHHTRLTYDLDERRVWCDACKCELENFDAFMALANQVGKCQANHERREKAIKEAEKNTLISRAAKIIDAEWRAKNTAPLCPHCATAILPEDIVRGVAKCSKALARKKRGLPQRVDGGEG